MNDNLLSRLVAANRMLEDVRNNLTDETLVPEVYQVLEYAKVVMRAAMMGNDTTYATELYIQAVFDLQDVITFKDE